MLKDYIGLISQAEEIEISKKDIVYNEAIKLLNQKKGNRLSQLINDVEKIVELIIVEFNNKEDIEDKNLIMGCYFSIKNIFDKYTLLMENLEPSFGDPKMKLNVICKDIEERFQRYYDYKQE